MTGSVYGIHQWNMQLGVCTRIQWWGEVSLAEIFSTGQKSLVTFYATYFQCMRCPPLQVPCGDLSSLHWIRTRGWIEHIQTFIWSMCSTWFNWSKFSSFASKAQSFSYQTTEGAFFFKEQSLSLWSHWLLPAAVSQPDFVSSVFLPLAARSLS